MVVQAAVERAAAAETRLQEVQAEATAAVPGGTSTMALLRKVRALEAQLLEEQTRRAAATAAVADVAAVQDAAAEAAALRAQLQAGEQLRAEQAAQLQQQEAQVRAAWLCGTTQDGFVYLDCD